MDTVAISSFRLLSLGELSFGLSPQGQSWKFNNKNHRNSDSNSNDNESNNNIPVLGGYIFNNYYPFCSLWKKKSLALVGVAQWIERQPANQRVAC